MPVYDTTINEQSYVLDTSKVYKNKHYPCDPFNECPWLDEYK